MKFSINHRTTFSYSQPVSISHHVLHLTPRALPYQFCERSGVIIDPAPSVRSESLDYFGNPVTHLTVQVPHPKLEVHANAQVDVTTPVLPELDQSPAWEEVRRQVEEAEDFERRDAYQFTFDSPYILGNEETFELGKECFPPGRPFLSGVMELTTRIFQDFTYEGGVTDVSTPIKEILKTRKGVCQDFAHLQIACLRSLGLPARYVSGYLLTHPPEGKEKLVGSDASHAWLSTWCPGIGWVDFDPTNNLIPRGEHITLAWGRDYGDVSPINGFMIGGGEHTLAVAVDVAPLDGN
ncbi:transglutaminase family protein [Candidatus Nitronereus thalassa]|uniref:Transglutaminase family protein n=1 Tax=Candidatus Nitronereus thalassa TaxID=3020898 RepID=A0ABU3K9V7_9BACT|nr:transglutaminase family protein [Candidatus Nitronereus thalassa]MDT7043225.1 transglutaminase family protein [Candidatus Nitronereus thalassa]